MLEHVHKTVKKDATRFKTLGTIEETERAVSVLLADDNNNRTPSTKGYVRPARHFAGGHEQVATNHNRNLRPPATSEQLPSPVLAVPTLPSTNATGSPPGLPPKSPSHPTSDLVMIPPHSDSR